MSAKLSLDVTKYFFRIQGIGVQCSSQKFKHLGKTYKSYNASPHRHSSGDNACETLITSKPAKTNSHCTRLRMNKTASLHEYVISLNQPTFLVFKAPPVA